MMMQDGGQGVQIVTGAVTPRPASAYVTDAAVPVLMNAVEAAPENLQSRQTLIANRPVPSLLPGLCRVAGSVAANTLEQRLLHICIKQLYTRLNFIQLV